MKKLSRIVSIALCIGMAAAMSACGAGSSTGTGGGSAGGADTNAAKYGKLDNGNIKILYFTSEAQYKQNKKDDPKSYDSVWDAKSSYEQQYGGKISFIICPWGDMTSKLITMLNTGDVPDVVQLHNQNFPLWPAKKAIQPLDGLLDFNVSYFNPVITKAYSLGGKHYAAGDSAAAILVYYNKTLFDNNGVEDPGTYYKQGKWNWDAFATCGKAMTYDDVWGFAWWEPYIPLMATNGSMLFNFNKDGSVTTSINTPNAIKALQFYQDGILKDKYINANVDGNSFVQAFENGKVAMTCEYGLGKYTSKYKLGVVPLPIGPDGSQDVTYGSATGWGVPTGAKNAKGAAAFIAMMSRLQADNETKSLYAQYPKADVDMYLRVTQKMLYSPDSGVSNFFGINWSLVQDIKKGTPVATIAANYEKQFNNAIKTTMKGQ